MAINKLFAGNVGNPLNSKGSDVANAVNALIDSATPLRGIKFLKPIDGIYQQTTGLHTDTYLGGRIYIYDSTLPWSNHTGVEVIAYGSLSVYDGTEATYAELITWVGTGFGCFILVNTSTIPVVSKFQIGKLTSAIRHAYLTNNLSISSAISVNDNTTIDGRNFTLLPQAGGTVIDVSGAGPQGYTALSANSNKGAFTFQSSASFAVGDYVFIRSNQILPPPNAEGVKVGQIFRIEAKTGSTYHVDRRFEYNFLTTESAEVALCLMRKNVTIENLTINNDDYSLQFYFGVWCKFVVNLTIKNLTITGTKVRNGTDVEGASAVKINHCLNVKVENVRTNHIGWYGIEVLGASWNVSLENVTGVDCRHTTSINWSEPYGEPMDVIHRKCHSFFSTLSGFDTHDVGQRIKYYDCVSIGSRGDSGYQQRANDVEYHGCYAANNFYDGFVSRTTTVKSRRFNCRSENNLRRGYNDGESGSVLIDCNARGNQSGVETIGGLIRGGEWLDNNLCFDCGGSSSAAQIPLVIEGVTAPYSVAQPRLLYFRSGQSRMPELVTLRNSRIVGYGNNVCIAQSFATKPKSPIMYGNELFDDNGTDTTTSGTFTLVAGAATVSSLAIERWYVTSTASSQLSMSPKIEIWPINQDVNTNRGYVYVDSIDRSDTVNQFTVKSTNPADTSTYQWRISY